MCYCKLRYLSVCKYLRNATILKYTWVVAFAHVWQILVTMSRENALWHERYLRSLINSLKLLGVGINSVAQEFPCLLLPQKY